MPCQKGKSSGSSVVIQSISKQTTNHKPISPLTSGHSLPGAGHCLVQAPGKQPGWAQCNTTESLVIWKRTCTQTPSSPSFSYMKGEEKSSLKSKHPRARMTYGIGLSHFCPRELSLLSATPEPPSCACYAQTAKLPLAPSQGSFSRR